MSSTFLVDQISACLEAMVVVSSVLAIGAGEGETVGMLGVKLTGVFAGLFSLVSLAFFFLYNEKSVTEFIESHRGAKEENEQN